MIGKQIRMERIINRETGNAVIVPLDHGFTMGPIPGLVNVKETVEKIAMGGANSVILHKGNVTAGHRGRGKDVGLVMHLSGSTSLSPDSANKVLVCTIEEAIKLGADGVSIHVNLGADYEHEMLKDFGKVGKACSDWGIPLIAMMYTRGSKIKNEYDEKNVSLAARVASEMGADMVKVSFTGDEDSFAKVIQGCSIPVLIAGGEKAESTKDVLKNVKMAMNVGGKGVSIGRNVFQHEDPALLCKAVSMIVNSNCSIEEAMEILGDHK